MNEWKLIDSTLYIQIYQKEDKTLIHNTLTEEIYLGIFHKNKIKATSEKLRVDERYLDFDKAYETLVTMRKAS